MKKILFITGPLNGGGAERVLIDILRHLDYGECCVDMLQVAAGGVLIDEVPSGVNVLTAWRGYTPGYKMALAASRCLGRHGLLRRRMETILAGKHYDVAISAMEGIPAKCHAMITNIADRNYSWVHCDLDTFRYETAVFSNEAEEVNAYNSMTAVICVSNDAEQAFKRRFADVTSNVITIYNPIDTDKIADMASKKIISNNCFTIAVCGRLTYQKRLDRVVSLAVKFKEHHIPAKIQIIGDGELRDDLQTQCLKMGVADYVEFVGYVRNPYPYIKSADMLLSTSGYEGFSLVLCEAMALGVPVISTKTAGPCEILDNNRYGLLCDHDDESIFRAVTTLFSDAALRQRYAQAGKERVKFFSPERAINAISKL